MYSYLKSTYFPNGIVPGQLSSLIIESITIPTFTSLNVHDDTVDIMFDSAIPDITTELNAIIASYTPLYYNYTTPYIVDNVLTNTINNVEYKYFGNLRFEIIISKNSQSHYNSLYEAIAANNTPNNIFIIYPGIYIEQNPIILPPGTTITSIGSTANTVIVAQDPNQDLLVLNTQCKLFGLTLNGAYGLGSRGIYFDGSLGGGLGGFTVIGECFIFDCNIGLECDGKNIAMADTIYCDKFIVAARQCNTAKGVYCHSGGQFITTTCYLNGNLSYTIAQAYVCIGNGSKISLCTASVWFCGTGVYIDNLGNVEITLLNMQYNNIGLLIGDTGTTSRVSASSIIFNNSATYDLSIEAIRANVEIYSSFLDDAKINNPNNVNITIRYNANKFGTYYQTILGDMQIGSHLLPSKLGVGEGLYINNGIVILSNDNLEVGTWTDNTTNALNGIGINFNLVNNVNAGNCMYIGSNKKIYGLKISVVTATSSTTLLDDVIWEFWNGTNWIEFKVFQSLPTTPTHAYLNSFISQEATYHIRFGLTSNAPFINKTLNGYSKHWIRYRLVNNISSIPICNQVKIHTNSCIINTDGSIQFMGQAREVKDFKINTYASNSSPGSQELFFASNLSIALTNNVFTYNNTIRLGCIFKMPIEIDISFPLLLNIGFIVDNVNAGNISWTLRYIWAKSNTNIYLNALDADNNPNPDIKTITKVTTINANTNFEDLRETIIVDVSRIPSCMSVTDKYFFYGTLERASGTDVNDTYPGNVILSYLDGNYVIWANGGHIEGFNY